MVDETQSQGVEHDPKAENDEWSGNNKRWAEHFAIYVRAEGNERLGEQMIMPATRVVDAHKSSDETPFEPGNVPSSAEAVSDTWSEIRCWDYRDTTLEVEMRATDEMERSAFTALADAVGEALPEDAEVFVHE
ncbi:hypothetical protein [Halomarina oriensis]|uniref:Uncharacterized protein n=1 Tax=Halomarina oriensis TaxID=671145 RepID=A0A6B0GVG6_9EURY|nr:hypothetical protein [Halomarina oriensis]MWG36583.1 hypothetical protein [Halomarina oriensis]